MSESSNPVHTCCTNQSPAVSDGSEERIQLADIVNALCTHCREDGKNGLASPKPMPLPKRSKIIEIVEELRSVLFPGYFGTSNINMENMRFHVGSALDHLQRAFSEQIRRGLCFRCPQVNAGDAKCHDCERRALRITNQFTAKLPEIQRMLAADVRAAFEGDPAANTPDEAIFCYPGILAITNYRIAHELYKLDVPVIPRIITEHAHSITGIDIHPGATIDEGLFIDHGTGVVVGETCIFGKHVKLYQGVTLGAKSFPKDEDGNPVKGIPRHPIVEDDVTIYSNATILGRVRIGRGSVIGGNVWLTHGVPPNSHVTQARLREDAFSDGGGI
ncbi:MAG: serine acetyltransferase [Deltaproteobacteria bacterium]|nr:serine acetyltransferase [Deltaproteobacteria bacterium]